MEIRAYSELYIEGAQNILGHMFDFALNEVGLSPDDFAGRFVVSSYSKQFSRGNVTYVAGKTGPELARLVLAASGYYGHIPEDIMFIDRSPEYWGGWILAYYQWLKDYPFGYILSAVPFSKLIEMHNIYHEMDIEHVVNELDRRINAYYPETALRRHRLTCGLSQRELADLSGVAIRQIQLFEQRQRNIRKASADTILRLSNVLSCDMEALML
ncbi:MAG: helix-turn-helix transcriptional regulator [Lachnospiraceae bacterium]|nr:helix-turn-helix transcriptional regulator [Lachnospiraceae bacterium]